ncbi:MAG: GGDEF domain-containing protein [Lachnospiraceae bacterium]|nr:GGDEF domain-containing protein [Lachnospiraceae bacterium]GFI03688.1 phytochrome-like protein cph2 [Lachnospiraceae bacterium]
MDELRYQVDLLSAMNQRLKNDEKMYRLICDTSSNAFLYVNFVENDVRTLANWEFFFPEVEIKDMKDLAKLYSQVEDKYVLPLRDLLFLEKTELNADSGIIKLKDGRTWVECESAILYNEEGDATDKVIRFKDISKFKSQNEELTYMAYYDVLTGLYNRNYFVRLLTDYVRKAEEENVIVAVMFVDIDDFRKINDGLGMIVGDEVVQQFGQFLSCFQSENVLVSHFNADIYCVAIYNPSGNRSLQHIYKAIHERVKTPFTLSTGQEILISASAGVAEYPEAAKTTLELINCAEIVMFKAKKLGKDTIQYFDAPILKEFLLNVNIENKLKEAVFSQNFTMNFQPQYYVNNKKMRGMEALIRWRDNDGKMISPSVFIPIAEKNGTIVPMGMWVIEESIKTFSDWKKKYDCSVILSLNISAIQYMQNEFVDNILAIIRKYDLNPEELELEITESVLIENFKEITEKMTILRDYGVRISLDDFGTGYSSLSYLMGLPIDTLKIDKSFIDTSITDENTKVIMESIIVMAKKLGFETIAEGVETMEQFDYLEEIGCECIQGYLLGKPMPKEDIEQLLLSKE